MRNKFDQLDAFLQSFDFSFDVMLTETCYTTDDTVEVLSNYENYNLCRNSKRGGGVSVYVKNTIHCSMIDEFSAITEDYKVWTLQHAHNVFCVVYRPPGGSMSCFLKYLDELFLFIGENNLKLVMGGDININMLLSSTQQSKFLTLYQSYGYICTICQPTRYSSANETLLDFLNKCTRGTCVCWCYRGDNK